MYCSFHCTKRAVRLADFLCFFNRVVTQFLAVTVHGVQEILNRFHIIEEPLQTLTESENSRDEQMQELTDILQDLGPQQETNKR